MLFSQLLACSFAGQWDAVGENPVALTDSDTAASTARPLLVITELMKDPEGVGDDVGEWFEVTNVGAEPVRLAGLAVESPGDDGFVVESDVTVAGGGRVVFGVSADPDENGGVTVDVAYPVDRLKLSNEGGTLGLYWDGVLVDEMSWDLLSDVEGRALSLDPDVEDADANDVAANWCPATTPFGGGDYGTPGGVNPDCVAGPIDGDGDGVTDAEDCDAADDEVFPGAEEVADEKDNDCDGWADERPPGPGDLVITELLDDPDPTDDADGEWFELQNVAGVPLELDGMEVSDRDGESVQVETDQLLVPGGFWLAAASGDPDDNDGLEPDYVFDRAAFHLENDKDEVVVVFGGETVDEVAYDDDFPHEKGKSRSLDPDSASASENDDADAWCKGDGDYGEDGNQGTPGAANDECG